MDLTTTLEALYRIGRLAAEQRPLGDVLRSILDVAQEANPQGHSAFLVLDPETATLRVRAARGYAEGVEGTPLAVGQGVAGRAAAAGEVVVVDDLAAHPEHRPGVPGARSEVGVPLLAGGRTIGVLSSGSREPGAYDQDRVRVLAVIAQQAAVLLHAAHLQEEARRQALTDALTGLPNRQHFLAQFEDHLRRARRYQEDLAVAYLAVDDLKVLNDRHGHPAGDQALQGVAAAMREWVRQTDEVARLDGAEFAVLLLQADRTSARQVLDRIRATVAERRLPELGGAESPLTLSAGIALFPSDGGESEWLRGRATAALREAKRRGGNRVMLAEDLPRDGAHASPAPETA